MKICIGIISYLPDDAKKREARVDKLYKLIEACNDIFKLPFIIVAQNWKGEKFNINDDSKIINYTEPLGIIGARQELRKIFLTSNFDYLIMLDDDCELTGTQESGIQYIKQIEEHPDMYGTWNGTLLKLFAISKEMFKQIDFGTGKVENGDYFEDILFVNTLKKKFPTKHFIFNKNDLVEKSNNYNDPNSTWFYGQFNKHDIGDRTRLILKEIK